MFRCGHFQGQQSVYFVTASWVPLTGGILDDTFFCVQYTHLRPLCWVSEIGNGASFFCSCFLHARLATDFVFRQYYFDAYDETSGTVEIFASDAFKVSLVLYFWKYYCTWY